MTPPPGLPGLIAYVRGRNRPNSIDGRLLAEIDRQAAEITRLRAGIQAVLDGDYPNPRQRRPGKCQHGAWHHEDCGACGDEWLARLLEPTKENADV